MSSCNEENLGGLTDQMLLHHALEFLNGCILSHSLATSVILYIARKLDLESYFMNEVCTL